MKTPEPHERKSVRALYRHHGDIVSAARDVERGEWGHSAQCRTSCFRRLSITTTFTTNDNDTNS